MNCIKALDLVTEALDDALEADVRADFDDHLAECPSCRRYVEQVVVSVETLKRSPTPGRSNPRRSELIEEFRKKFRS